MLNTSRNPRSNRIFNNRQGRINIIPKQKIILRRRNKTDSTSIQKRKRVGTIGNIIIIIIKKRQGLSRPINLNQSK